MKPVKFPLLARHLISHLVVLFTDETSGTVIVRNGVVGYPIGYTGNEWVSVLSPTSWEILPVGTTIELTISE